jgi:GNAT superfamily N-acetyltransferase
MDVVTLSDKNEIYQYLIKNKYLHIYSIGDLDDFFWPYTKWYGLKEGSEISAIALFYTGLSEPTILALSDNIEPLKILLQKVMKNMPDNFYCHLSPGLDSLFREDFELKSHGSHYKMGLIDKSKLDIFESTDIIRFNKNDHLELEAFYKEAYPGNWFDARMLETGHYYGIRNEGKITAVAGVHVYSAKYKVAALGNIATHPVMRGKGLGMIVTAHCCRELLKTVDTIGLNVSQDNAPAISVYRKLGFEVKAEYEEYEMRRR